MKALVRSPIWPVCAVILSAGSCAEGTGPISVTSCRLPGASEDFRCARVEVPEVRLSSGGRRITLNVVVLPARTQPAKSDPVLYLAGGPGQGATTGWPLFVNHPAREDRDIVLVDQRGTGESNPLSCPGLGGDDDLQSYFRSAFEPNGIRACRTFWSGRAEIDAYGTENVIEDLEEVRRAMGYDRFNVIGISGGTRTALMYAAAKPAALRAMILTGLVPPELKNPLHGARAGEEGLAALLAACSASSACGSTFSGTHAKLDSVLDRLARQSASVTVHHPLSGVAVTVQVDRYAFADGIRTMLYASAVGRFVPAVIDAAYRGNYGPAATMMLARARSLRESIAMGTLLTIVCGEDVSRIREDEIAPAVSGTFIGDARIRTQQAACAEWQPASAPHGMSSGFVSDVPTLLLSGRYDPVTPSYWADSAALHLRHSAHLVTETAHGQFTACLDEIVTQVIHTASVNGLATSCADAIQLPPFATTAELAQRLGRRPGP